MCGPGFNFELPLARKKDAPRMQPRCQTAARNNEFRVRISFRVHAWSGCTLHWRGRGENWIIEVGTRNLPSPPLPRTDGLHKFSHFPVEEYEHNGIFVRDFFFGTETVLRFFLTYDERKGASFLRACDPRSEPQRRAASETIRKSHHHHHRLTALSAAWCEFFFFHFPGERYGQMV